jgi:hypothetical protein
MIIGEDIIIIDRDELEDEEVQKKLVENISTKKRLVVKEGERRVTVINLEKATFYHVHGEIICVEFENKVDVYVDPREIREVYPENDGV